MRQRSTVINDGAKVANINPSPARGTSNLAVRRVYTGAACRSSRYLPRGIGLIAKPPIRFDI
jgi:hypothetical protein